MFIPYISVDPETILILTLVSSVALSLMLTLGVNGAIETNLFFSIVNANAWCQHSLKLNSHRTKVKARDHFKRIQVLCQWSFSKMFSLNLLNSVTKYLSLQ